MANYTTNLKEWGSVGQEFPDSYNYLEGEQPVDAWDNFVFHNIIEDIKNHLIPLTNSRIESDYGASAPSSPVDGHLFYDTGSKDIERYRTDTSAWEDLAWGGDLRTHEADTNNPHSVSLEQARSVNNTLSGDLDVSDNAIVNGSNTVIQVGNNSTNLAPTAQDGTGKTGLYDRANTQWILEAHEGGNVDIPNGDLDINGNLLKQAGRVIAGTGAFQIHTDGSGTGYSSLWDRANGQSILTANEGGNVEIPNGITTFGDDQLLDQGSSSLVDGGSINSPLTRLRGYYDSDGTTGVTASSVDAIIEHAVYSSGGSALDLKVQGSNVIKARSSGNVEIANGEIRVTANKGKAALRGHKANVQDNSTDSNGNPTHYGHFNFDNSNGTRGAYIGYGNGAGVIDFYLDNASKLKLNGGDLDVANNHIKRANNIYFNHSIGQLISNGGGSDKIRLWDDANGQPLFTANEGGNIEIPNGDLTVSGGDLHVGDNGIHTNAESPSIVIDDLDNANAINQGLIASFSGASEDSVKWERNVNNQSAFRVFNKTGGYAIFQAFDGGNVEIPNGNLSLNGMINSTSSVLNVNTNGGGGDRFGVYDTANGQDIARFNEGGNVVIPNGDISVKNGGRYILESTTPNDAFRTANTGTAGGTFTHRIDDADYRFWMYDSSSGNGTETLKMEYDTNDVHIPDGNLHIPSGSIQIDNGSPANFLEVSDSGTGVWNFHYDNSPQKIGIWDRVNGLFALELYQGGDVSIPNGDLNIGVDGIVNSSTGGGLLKLNGNDEVVVETNGSGTGRFRIWDSANVQAVIDINEGGNVEIPNGNLDISSNRVAGDHGFINDHNNGWTLSTTVSGGHVDLYDSVNGQETLRAHVGGNVEIPNGRLNLNSHRVKNVKNLEAASGVIFGPLTNGGDYRVWDGTNNQRILTAHEGGNVAVPNGSITQGSDPSHTILESTSPKSWEFDGSTERDIHRETQVDLKNTTSSSATEDITVELYDGVDTTGTLLASETRTITIGANTDTAWESFIVQDISLDTGTYHIEITQSGTTLTVEASRENTNGATYEFNQSTTGSLNITNQDGNNLAKLEKQGNLKITGSLTENSSI